MNSKIFLLSAIFMLAACGESDPAKKAVSDFVEICKLDPKSANFDCECQASMMKDKVGKERFVKFVDFLKLDKSQLVSADKELVDITMEISNFAPVLIKNCGK